MAQYVFSKSLFRKSTCLSKTLILPTFVLNYDVTYEQRAMAVNCPYFPNLAFKKQGKIIHENE